MILFFISLQGNVYVKWSGIKLVILNPESVHCNRNMNVIPVVYVILKLNTNSSLGDERETLSQKKKNYQPKTNFF